MRWRCATCCGTDDDDPRALVQAFDEVTESRITPWYHAQIADDRARFADMEALREGREPVPPSDALAMGIRSLRMAMAADADLFRAGIEYIATLTPRAGDPAAAGRGGEDSRGARGDEGTAAVPVSWTEPDPAAGPGDVIRHLRGSANATT